MRSGLDALVLAGGEAEPHLWRGTGIREKALLEVGGVRLLDRALDAVRDAGLFEQVAIVSSPRVLDGAPGDLVRVPQRGHIGENLLAGLRALRGEAVVVLGADMPFLTAAHLREFVAAVPPDAAFAYPIVSEDRLLEAFYPRRHRLLALREGRFIGPSFGYLRRRAAFAASAVGGTLLRGRRSHAELARRIGPFFLARHLLGGWLPAARPSIAEIEATLSRLLGAPARAIVTSDARPVFDVDFYDELRQAAFLDACADRPHGAWQGAVCVCVVGGDAAARRRTESSLVRACPTGVSLAVDHLEAVGLPQAFVQHAADRIAVVDAGLEVPMGWFESFAAALADADVAVGPTLCRRGVTGRFLDVRAFMGPLVSPAAPFHPYHRNFWCRLRPYSFGLLGEAARLGPAHLLWRAAEEGLAVTLAAGAPAVLHAAPGLRATLRLESARKRAGRGGGTLSWRTFSPFASPVENLWFLTLERLTTWLAAQSEKPWLD